MNPENIKKFETTSDNDNNIRKELLLLCINDNVIICPHTSSIYSWNIPESSSDSTIETWSKLITIEHKNKWMPPRTIWERDTNGSNMNHVQLDIDHIIKNSYPLYYAPIKDIYYEAIDNGTRFAIYTRYIDNFFLIRNNSGHCIVPWSYVPNNNIDEVFNLQTNVGINFTKEDIWTNINSDGGWESSSVMDEYNNDIMKLIHNINSDEENVNSHEEVVEEDEEVVEEDEEDDDVDEDEDEDDDEDDEDYVEEEEEEEEEEYDLKIAEGKMVSPPSEEEELRMDDRNGLWYTKHEFMDYYGSRAYWKSMHPKKQLKRRALYEANYYASHMSIELRGTFITNYLETFNLE